MKYTIFIFSFIISLGLNAQLKIEKNKSSVCITDLLNTTTVCKDASDFYVFEKDARIWIINNDVQSDLASGTNTIRLIGKRPLLIDDIMWTSSVPSVAKPTSIKNAVKLLSSNYFTDAKDTSVVFTKTLEGPTFGTVQSEVMIVNGEFNNIDCACLKVIVQNTGSTNGDLTYKGATFNIGHPGNTEGFPTSYIFESVFDQSKGKYTPIGLIEIDANETTILATKIYAQ